MKQDIQLKNGTQILLINDPKHNTVRMSARWLFELNQKDALLANLLVQMMNDRLETNPSKESMTQRLDNLFGTKLTARTYASGKYQVIEVVSMSIGDSFVDTSLTQAQCELIHDVLYQVLINPSTLDEAKENALRVIDRIREKKNMYATLLAFEKAAKSSVFSINTYSLYNGSQSDIEQLEVSDLKDFHSRLIRTAKKIVIAAGPLPKLDFSIFDDEFVVNHDIEISNQTEVNQDYVEIDHAGSQSELIQVYATDILPQDPLYAAYLVYVAYLGQLPSSLLFQNVREKHSLAYSIYASRHIFDGIMYISASIQADKAEQVISLIKDQFEIIETQDINIKGAIKYMETSLISMSETQGQQIEASFRDAILGAEFSVENLINQVRSVSVEDVKEISKHLSLPFTLLYKGVSHEAN